MDLPVSLYCYGAIHEITCHLFIYAAPDATRRSLNEKSKSSSNVTSVKKLWERRTHAFTPHYIPAGRSDANQ